MGKGFSIESVVSLVPSLKTSNSNFLELASRWGMAVVTASVYVWFTRVPRAVSEVGIQDNVVTPFPTLNFPLTRQKYVPYRIILYAHSLGEHI